MNSNYTQRFYAEPSESKMANELQRYDYNRNEKADSNIYHDQKNKAFYVENVDYNKLNIDAPSLNFKVFSTQDKNKFKVEYEPEDNEHHVTVKHNGQHVEGSPFMLAPALPTVKIAEDKGLVTFQNVGKFENLNIKSDNLRYDIYNDKNDERTFHMKYYPENGIHDVDVSYNGHSLEEGEFRLVPKELRSAYQQHGVVNVDGSLQINTPAEEHKFGTLMYEHKSEETGKHKLMAGNTDNTNEKEPQTKNEKPLPQNVSTQKIGRMIRNNNPVEAFDSNGHREQAYKAGETLYDAPPSHANISKSYY